MRDKTKLVHSGRHPHENFGVVNPPVYHASTILYKDKDSFDNYNRLPTTYGRHGTPGTFALSDALADLEGADHCLLTPSGLAAITVSLLSFLEAGDHVLAADTVYDPTRSVCNSLLTRYGIETTYYDPLLGADIARLVQDNTRVVFMESPGSRTFEMQDVPAIVGVLKTCRTAKPIVTMIDNTWATPLYYKPLAHGVDISIQSITKYIGGHADLMLGSIACQKAHWPAVDKTRRLLGNSVGPDDVYLAQRGLRSLAARLRQHGESGLRVAEWLEARPEVIRIMHPALPGDPGHDIWKRDFSGATGLFGFVLKPASQEKVDAFLNSLTLFGIGFSWGGYESLLIPSEVSQHRTATKWQPGGPTFRIHVGLEDPEDLIEDLEKALEVYSSV